MKRWSILCIMVISGLSLLAGNNTNQKFIFVPHPRSEDQIKQSVNPGIAKINFADYDVIMLGGDLTYSTSKNAATLQYCDSLFNISSPNTLWGFGNHDVESGNRSLIKQFTGRDSYYAWYHNQVTFMVLDCELNAQSFSATYIKGDQLQMVKNVCDTISKSNFLVLLHSRYIWMINNNEFNDKLDSIAASSKSMDTTNFYSDIYPLLKKVKSRGIQVKVFGGDKSLINVTYSKEDSITFYAARMVNTFPDSINNVIVVDYNQSGKTMTCRYVTLADINKTSSDSTVSSPAIVLPSKPQFDIIQKRGRIISLSINVPTEGICEVRIYSSSGTLVDTETLSTGNPLDISFHTPGVYVAYAAVQQSVIVKKFLVR